MNISPDVPDVLKDILQRKADEVAALKAEISEQGDAHVLSATIAKRGSHKRKMAFRKALTLPPGSLTVISEIKRRSPSKGHIGYIRDPALLSRIYHEGGAGAISVLTDGPGFGGSMDDLRAVVKAQGRFKGDFPGPCPVLRKEFIVDEVQIAEAAANGAAAVLLIVAALGAQRTAELIEATHAYGLDALVEVHDRSELDIALEAGAEIIGVNNRNLRTFETSLDVSFDLIKHIPDNVVRVAESGVSDVIDAWRLRDAGFSAVLVGETLVKAFEDSASDATSYSPGYNQAKGYIKAFKSKGSVQFGNANLGPFYGKGEGAKETLGEMSI